MFTKLIRSLCRLITIPDDSHHHGRIWDGSKGGAKRYYGPLPGGPWGPCRGPVHGLGALYGASRGGAMAPQAPPQIRLCASENGENERPVSDRS